MDHWNITTLEQAKQSAKEIAAHAKASGAPCAMEVVATKSKPFVVQPFGMHTLFKSHKLLHVEPIPGGEVAA